MTIMASIKESAWILNCADIVAWDRDGQIILLVGVWADEGRPENGWVADDLEVLAETHQIPYVMCVTYRTILILDVERARMRESAESSGPPEPVRTPVLQSADILGRYDVEFSQKQVFKTYLRTLTDVWLMDLARHGECGGLPGSRELAALGLLRRLKGGSTHLAGAPDDHPLY